MGIFSSSTQLPSYKTWLIRSKDRNIKVGSLLLEFAILLQLVIDVGDKDWM